MVVAEISIKLIFLPKRKETSVPLLGKNFRTAPYFIMHARLINYAFYSLSLNTIDNSLTSLIITYCTNKRGFFFTVFLSALFFPLSLSLSLHFPLFLFPISLLPPRPLLVSYFFFYVTCRVRTLNSLSSSSD